MKKITAVLIVLLLAATAFAAQNSNSKSAKTSNTKSSNTKATAKKPAADCSGMSDAQITAAVKEKLSKTPSLKDASIDVATNAGVVTLTGKLKTGGLKGVATNQAKRASTCVKKVDNKIEVESKAAPSKNAAPKPAKNKNTK